MMGSEVARPGVTGSSFFRPTDSDWIETGMSPSSISAVDPEETYAASIWAPQSAGRYMHVDAPIHWLAGGVVDGEDRRRRRRPDSSEIQVDSLLRQGRGIVHRDALLRCEALFRSGFCAVLNAPVAPASVPSAPDGHDVALHRKTIVTISRQCVSRVEPPTRRTRSAARLGRPALGGGCAQGRVCSQ